MEKLENWMLMLVFFLGMLAGVGFLIIPGCNSDHPPISIKIWAGDSASASIARSQAGESIECRDAKFDDYLCVSQDDYRQIFQLIQKCKEWGP